MDITFTIPNEKISRLVAMLNDKFPQPNIGIDDENPEYEFTDSQWAKESIRLWLINQTRKFEETQEKDAVVVVKDNDLIS